MYILPQSGPWTGRHDALDGEAGRRWHHIMKYFNISDADVPPKNTTAVALLGFCCDEGVRRNQGRLGAREAPAHLRAALANMAFHTPEVSIYDAGDILCEEEDLEDAQKYLAEGVQQLLQHGIFPIVMGGGHETAYGHFKGLHNHLGTSRKIGIINFDAHFDLRQYEKYGSSGTPFLQIAELLAANKQQLHYLALGINKASNTKALFDTAKKHKAQWLSNDELASTRLYQSQQAIKAFISQVDDIYITIDLDVFQASYAPGVSAPASFGIEPSVARQLLSTIFLSGKVASLDIVELCPKFDIDGRTAKLGAHLIYEAVSLLAE